MTTKLCDVCGRPLEWHEKRASWGGFGKLAPVPCTPPPPPAQQSGGDSGIGDAIAILIGLIILFAILGWAWRLL